MTQPTTDLDLDAIETRAAAATPGPWRDHDTHLGQYGYTATVLSGEGNDTDLRAWLPSMSQEPWDETRNVWADAAFIAALNPAVALALVAEVRRLRSNAPAETRYLEDGSTRTIQALTDAGEACVQQECGSAREEKQLRQERYALRAAVEDVLDDIRDMADDERITAEVAGELRARLRDALGLDGPVEETHVVADDSDDPEHTDDCPGCEAFTLTGHRAAKGAQR